MVALQASTAGRTNEGIFAVRTIAERVLPYMGVKTRLERDLERFESRLVVLTVALLALSVPIVLMVLGFMRLSVSLAIERQRQEVALLRSRGVGVVQLVGVFRRRGAAELGRRRWRSAWRWAWALPRRSDKRRASWPSTPERRCTLP